jgi:hypothetical protein
MSSLSISTLPLAALIFGIYTLTCIIVCWRNADSNRFLVMYLAGLLLLPNQQYSANLTSQNHHDVFAFWYIGGALPSDILLTKALVVPSSLTLCLVIFRFEKLKNLRLNIADVCVALWILIPVLRSTTSSAYLLGVWGGSWLLGRALFQGERALQMFAWSLVISTNLMSPLAIVEMFHGPFLYDAIYQAHPFSQDGAHRYLGFRPMLLFEHGNQFGLWTAVAACAGFWLLLSRRSSLKTFSAVKVLACCVPALLCIASQSLGAIGLGIVACTTMMFWRYINLRKVIATALIGISLTIGIISSGVIRPQQVDYMVRNTKPGQMTLEFFRSIGKGSLPWRISQDLRTAHLASDWLTTGTGRWDWWRESGTRPWGLYQLIVGQFGMIGALLSGLILLLTSTLALWRNILTPTNNIPSSTQAIAIFILIGTVDALLNSFIFYPMLLLSGAICSDRT